VEVEGDEAKVAARLERALKTFKAFAETAAERRSSAPRRSFITITPRLSGPPAWPALIAACAERGGQVIVAGPSLAPSP
jgi:hypothetical protein